jgi:hypothetical protein
MPTEYKNTNTRESMKDREGNTVKVGDYVFITYGDFYKFGQVELITSHRSEFSYGNNVYANVSGLHPHLVAVSSHRLIVCAGKDD